jgi:hypothetical protein
MAVALLWILFGAAAALGDGARQKPPKAGREEGTYKILVAGVEVGSEKYAIATTAEGTSSTSVLDFRNPAGSPQKLHFESQLEMDPQFRPRNYRLATDVDGTRGFLVAQFGANQVMFEYGGQGQPHKSGVLVGADYTLLDTNIFHHFIFLARRYDFGGKEKVQRREVVIPQESESGFLKVSEVGRETVLVGSKRHDAHHLKLDSGAKLIDLWVDRQGIVHKIAVPTQGIEILRQ